MSHKRRVAYLLMIGAIIRHLVSNEYGPLDRLLELGVFALIAYEVAVTGFRHWQERKRHSFLKKQVTCLSDFMGRGQRLQQSVPNQETAEGDALVNWIKAVELWRGETDTFLSLHSPRASAAFSLVVDSHKVDSLAYPAEGFSFDLYGGIRESYQRLLAQLRNLRGIMGQKCTSNLCEQPLVEG